MTCVGLCGDNSEMRLKVNDAVSSSGQKEEFKNKFGSDIRVIKPSRIITALASGPLTVKEISEKTEIPATTVYNNIRVLREQLLIEKQKTLYTLTLKGRKYLEL